MKRMFDENEIKQIASEAGGGKLYLHKIIAHCSDHPGDIYLSIINNSITPITGNSQLLTYISNGIPAYYNGSEGTGAVAISIYTLATYKYRVQGAIASDSSQLTPIKFEDAFSSIEDTVVEL